MTTKKSTSGGKGNEKVRRQVKHIEEGMMNGLPDKERAKRAKAMGDDIEKEVKVETPKKGEKKRSTAKKAEGKKAYTRSGVKGGRKARR